MKKNTGSIKIISKLLIITLFLNNISISAAPNTTTKNNTGVKSVKMHTVNRAKASSTATPSTDQSQTSNACPNIGSNDYCNIPWISQQQAAPSQDDCSKMKDDAERKSKGCFDATSVCDQSLSSGNPNAPVTINDFAGTVSNALALQNAISDAANKYSDAQNQLLQTFDAQDMQGKTVSKNCLYYLTTPNYQSEVKTPMPAQCTFNVNDLEKASKTLLDSQTQLINLLTNQACFDQTGYDLSVTPIQAGSKVIQVMSNYPACAINQAIQRMLNTQKVWSKECATFLTAQQQAQYQKQLDDQKKMQDSQKPSDMAVWGQIIGGGLISAAAFIGGQSLANKFFPGGENIGKISKTGEGIEEGVEGAMSGLKGVEGSIEGATEVVEEGATILKALPK